MLLCCYPPEFFNTEWNVVRFPLVERRDKDELCFPVAHSFGCE